MDNGPRLSLSLPLSLVGLLVLGGCAATGGLSGGDECTPDINPCAVGSCSFDGLRYTCGGDTTYPTDGGTDPVVTPDPVESECDPGCTGDQQCRGGRCISPDPNGEVCEFDSECAGLGEEYLCISGYCTPDPRLTACESDAECPVGFVCEDGMCDPGGGCVDDSECGDMVCIVGECRDPAECDVVHPDLTGDWTWNSTLDTREGLSGFADAVLRIASAADDFLNGGSISLPGIFSFLEPVFNAELRRVVNENVPHAILEAIGGLATFDRIVQTMTLEERVQLTAFELDRYNASRELLQICLGEGADMRCATDPSDLESFGFDPDDFRANAVCNEFIILKHDIDFDFTGLLLWAVNAVVEGGSEGEYDTLEELIDAMNAQVCPEIGDAIADFAGGTAASSSATLIGGLASAWCDATLDTLRDRVVMGLADATSDLSLIEIKGHAPVGERTMNGIWEGSLMGGDFPGSFQAFR